MDEAFTFETLRKLMHITRGIPPPPRIIVTPLAVDRTKITGENFKNSRHRSKRVQKKLLKRYGEQFIYAPVCIEHKPSGVTYMHPAIFDELQRQAKMQAQSMERDLEQMFVHSLIGIPVTRSRS